MEDGQIGQSLGYAPKPVGQERGQGPDLAQTLPLHMVEPPAPALEQTQKPAVRGYVQVQRKSKWAVLLCNNFSGNSPVANPLTKTL